MSLARRYKLDIEERDNLASLLDLEEFQTLLKCIAVEVQDFEDQLVVYNITSKEDSLRELTLLKARAEGAALLYKRIAAMKQTNKNKSAE